MKETMHKIKYRHSSLRDRSVKHNCVEAAVLGGETWQQGVRSTGVERGLWSWDGDVYRIRAQQRSGFTRKEREAMGTH